MPPAEPSTHGRIQQAVACLSSPTYAGELAEVRVWPLGVVQRYEFCSQAGGSPTIPWRGALTYSSPPPDPKVPQGNLRNLWRRVVVAYRELHWVHSRTASGWRFWHTWKTGDN